VAGVQRERAEPESGVGGLGVFVEEYLAFGRVRRILDMGLPRYGRAIRTGRRAVWHGTVHLSEPLSAEEGMGEVALDIQGLGIILYSPPAVAHIPEGVDYLQEHFWQPADVARHVMGCRLTTFATGSPGLFRLRFRGGPPDEVADYKLRLGLRVETGVVCARDLYDLVQWSAACPPEQQLSASDGWYRLTVYTSLPSSGLVGDSQTIDINLEQVTDRPVLRWDGVPMLCD
jgi:hypothetical protein